MGKSHRTGAVVVPVPACQAFPPACHSMYWQESTFYFYFYFITSSVATSETSLCHWQHLQPIFNNPLLLPCSLPSSSEGNILVQRRGCLNPGEEHSKTYCGGWKTWEETITWVRSRIKGTWEMIRWKSGQELTGICCLKGEWPQSWATQHTDWGPSVYWHKNFCDRKK